MWITSHSPWNSLHQLMEVNRWTCTCVVHEREGKSRINFMSKETHGCYQCELSSTTRASTLNSCVLCEYFILAYEVESTFMQVSTKCRARVPRAHYCFLVRGRKSRLCSIPSSSPLLIPLSRRAEQGLPESTTPARRERELWQQWEKREGAGEKKGRQGIMGERDESSEGIWSLYSPP